MSEPVRWEGHAARLADELHAAGKLTDPALREAVRRVPRHLLVPTHHQARPDGTWTMRRSNEDLEAVYTNSVLITALDAAGAVLSSSSQPGLMTRMIEALDVSHGARVLEIGTGTGYNAALLCHLVGERDVVSVDVEPDLVATARERLTALGLTPHLVVGDGADGVAEHAPYHAILSTCAVSAIPTAWITQLSSGGVILTDLKIAPGAGSLVRLVTEGPSRAEGRFDSTYAAFMHHRPAPGAAPRHRRPKATADLPRARTTRLDAQTPWRSLLVWFLAALDLGSDLAYGYTLDDDRTAPVATWIATADGSRAEIDLAVDGGHHAVRETGPRDLWALVERATQLWESLGEPGWDRFGLTVTSERDHLLWLDDPRHVLRTWRP